MSCDLTEDGEFQSVVISKDWSNLRFKENKKYLLPLWKKNIELSENVAYLFRDDWDYNYQVPDYNSAINDIMLEDEISKFNLANTKNGWAPRLMISTFGPYEQNEMRGIMEQIDQAYSGSENAGRVVYMHSSDPAFKPVIEPINYNLNDASYVNLVVSTKDYILSAHKCTSPALAGLSIGNTGFENQGDALLASYNLYDQLAISQYRYNLDAEINKILKICNFNFEIKMSLKKLKIDTNEINN